jgi:hypothetical protein
MNIWTAIILTFLFRLAKFALIFGAGLALAKLIEQRANLKRPLGITMVGTFIIAGAVYDLIKFMDWEYYQFTFQGLSYSAIGVRYAFSLLDRAALLFAGIGILFLNDLARRATIVLAYIQILAIPWKHPIEVFQHLSLHTQQQTLPASTQLVHAWQPWITFAFFSIFDIAIASFIIYYFSRSSTRKNFIGGA